LLVGAEVAANAESALNPADHRKIFMWRELEEEDHFFPGDEARNARNVRGEITDGAAEQAHRQIFV
jgi:hypothetical protein